MDPDPGRERRTVAEVLAAVAADLAEAARMLTDGDPKSVATLLDVGQAGWPGSRQARRRAA
jgi:hypothetical protein